MTVKPQQETKSFQTEVNRLLHLVTHSLYSNKEIFLRELISNASDAADKLRFEGLNDQALFENDAELDITIDIDKKKRTITVRDNGIGMSRDEAAENLGVIAKSGTSDFLSKLTGDQSKDSKLIGQFGVGFYSAFVVADKVVVKTRRAGMQPDQGVQWESAGEGKFTIKNINKEQRGTEIILHLKKEEDEFLEEMTLRNLIRKYSDHILLPVKMLKPAEDDKKSGEYETVNRATALWTLPRDKIKDEEYKELYKHISHDFNEPVSWSHNKVEGKLEYTTLLYLPAKAPFDLWNRDVQKGLKLYVQRVFIMDDAEQLLPMYLRFIKGIVDSNDLPLNVSREILQSNRVIDSIRAGCIKRSLDMLSQLSRKDPEQYQQFWDQFGAVLKEGPGEDFANKEKIAELLRFSTTKDDSQKQTVSLADYVGRMQEGQDKIYYVTADTFSAAKNSPHLEIFRKNNIEVLLLTDKVDEWLVAHLTEFDGKKLQSVAKGDVAVGDAKEKEKQEAEVKKKSEQCESLIKQIKEVLGDKVKEVRVSNRLTDSPACLIADENEMSIHLQNMLKAAGQDLPNFSPIFEINPDHALIKKMNDVTDQDQFADWASVLFDQAQLAQGSQLDDPGSFVKRLNKLLLEI